MYFFCFCLLHQKNCTQNQKLSIFKMKYRKCVCFVCVCAAKLVWFIIKHNPFFSLLLIVGKAPSFNSLALQIRSWITIETSEKGHKKVSAQCHYYFSFFPLSTSLPPCISPDRKYGVNVWSWKTGNILLSTFSSTRHARDAFWLSLADYQGQVVVMIPSTWLWGLMR